MTYILYPYIYLVSLCPCASLGHQFHDVSIEVERYSTRIHRATMTMYMYPSAFSTSQKYCKHRLEFDVSSSKSGTQIPRDIYNVQVLCILLWQFFRLCLPLASVSCIPLHPTGVPQWSLSSRVVVVVWARMILFEKVTFHNPFVKKAEIKNMADSNDL